MPVFSLVISAENLTLTASTGPSYRFDFVTSPFAKFSCLLNALPLSYYHLNLRCSKGEKKKKMFLPPKLDPPSTVSIFVMVISVHVLDHHIGKLYPFIPVFSVKGPSSLPGRTYEGSALGT